MVQENLIITHSNTLLGGIKLIDYGPFDGDYSGTIVRHNRIEAPGGYIIVCIAAGPVVRGGSITDNSMYPLTALILESCRHFGAGYRKTIETC